MNVPPLECHITDLSLASTNELDDRVCTAVVLREPLFTDHGTETGTKTGGETGKPKAVDRDRDGGGSEGNCWVGYGFEAWVTAIQDLVKEQGRLLLIIWSQIIESPNEEGCDDGREQSSLHVASVRSESTIAPEDETHENEEHV